jgi:hypothetical protein
VIWYTINEVYENCASPSSDDEDAAITFFRNICKLLADYKETFQKPMVRASNLTVHKVVLGMDVCVLVSNETANRPSKKLMRTYHWISLFVSYIKSAK